ncbi:MAG: aminoacyl-tRNA hydrolase [Mycoplasmataceae bacterium]|jgi:PTH1 family peptidyl-tRNA hydrolase|nr:aminoacyl-tRNA hydrolase [Mycoplasmataceae bacterium]
MKLIVGLGNFQKKYENTRHNVGFMAIDNFCKENKIILNEEKFNGVYFKDNDYIIAKPLTNMNLSGKFVSAIVKFYKINLEDILIIHDDVSFDIGSIKLKSSGSSGGQNGIRNIMELLKTEQIKRVKLGIGRNKQMILADYVLSKFNDKEREELKQVFATTNEIIHEFISGINYDKIMSKFNKN